MIFSRPGRCWEGGSSSACIFPDSIPPWPLPRNRLVRSQCLHPDRPRRIRYLHHQPLGDGAGDIHRLCHAHRRGTGVRLEKVRVENRPGRPGLQQPRLRHTGDRREHRYLDGVGQAPTMGASAREMLIAAAAKGWKVEPADCRAENGRVIHKSGKVRRLTANWSTGRKGAGTQGCEAQRTREAARSSAKPLHRLDSPVKIDGTAQFGLDVRLPGMLTAVVAHPPVFGGKVKSFKADKAKAVPGVKRGGPGPVRGGGGRRQASGRRTRGGTAWRLSGTKGNGRKSRHRRDAWRNTRGWP